MSIPSPAEADAASKDREHRGRWGEDEAAPERDGVLQTAICADVIESARVAETRLGRPSR